MLNNSNCISINNNNNNSNNNNSNINSLIPINISANELLSMSLVNSNYAGQSILNVLDNLQNGQLIQLSQIPNLQQNQLSDLSQINYTPQVQSFIPITNSPIGYNLNNNNDNLLNKPEDYLKLKQEIKRLTLSQHKRIKGNNQEIRYLNKDIHSIDNDINAIFQHMQHQDNKIENLKKELFYLQNKNEKEKNKYKRKHNGKNKNTKNTNQVWRQKNNNCSSNSSDYSSFQSASSKNVNSSNILESSESQLISNEELSIEIEEDNNSSALNDLNQSYLIEKTTSSLLDEFQENQNVNNKIDIKDEKKLKKNNSKKRTRRRKQTKQNAKDKYIEEVQKDDIPSIPEEPMRDLVVLDTIIPAFSNISKWNECIEDEKQQLNINNNFDLKQDENEPSNIINHDSYQNCQLEQKAEEKSVKDNVKNKNKNSNNKKCLNKNIKNKTNQNKKNAIYNKKSKIDKNHHYVNTNNRSLHKNSHKRNKNKKVASTKKTINAIINISWESSIKNELDKQTINSITSNEKYISILEKTKNYKTIRLISDLTVDNEIQQLRDGLTTFKLYSELLNDFANDKNGNINEKRILIKEFINEKFGSSLAGIFESIHIKTGVYFLISKIEIKTNSISARKDKLDQCYKEIFGNRSTKNIEREMESYMKDIFLQKPNGMNSRSFVNIVNQYSTLLLKTNDFNKTMDTDIKDFSYFKKLIYSKT